MCVKAVGWEVGDVVGHVRRMGEIAKVRRSDSTTKHGRHCSSNVVLAWRGHTRKSRRGHPKGRGELGRKRGGRHWRKIGS